MGGTAPPLAFALSSVCLQSTEYRVELYMGTILSGVGADLANFRNLGLAPRAGIAARRVLPAIAWSRCLICF